MVVTERLRCINDNLEGKASIIMDATFSKDFITVIFTATNMVTGKSHALSAMADSEQAFDIVANSLLNAITIHVYSLWMRD